MEIALLAPAAWSGYGFARTAFQKARFLGTIKKNTGFADKQHVQHRIWYKSSPETPFFKSTYEPLFTTFKDEQIQVKLPTKNLDISSSKIVLSDPVKTQEYMHPHEMHDWFKQEDVECSILTATKYEKETYEIDPSKPVIVNQINNKWIIGHNRFRVMNKSYDSVWSWFGYLLGTAIFAWLYYGFTSRPYETWTEYMARKYGMIAD